MEQTTTQKIHVVGGRIIIAGTGQVGLGQRFKAVVERLWKDKQLSGIKNGIDFAKALSSAGLKDFNETHLQKFGYSAIVAYPAGGEPHLCEIDGNSGFQPEMKDPNDLWCASVGSGQGITDPFLALLRQTLWPDGPPSSRGGIFMTLWALRHAIRYNAGGVGEPIFISVLERTKDGYEARILTAEAIAEAGNIVDAAVQHLAGFKDVLLGTGDGPSPPTVKP